MRCLLMTKIVNELRNKMAHEGIDAYIIPSFDFHQSEYVADYFKVREWLTGFTGSAGFAVVTESCALLWTDGRYHIQAERELINGPFELMRQGLPNTPTLGQWLVQNLKSDSVIALDGRCYSELGMRALKEETKALNLKFKTDQCLLTDLWSQRPKFPKEESFELPLNFAGLSRLEKINSVRKRIVNQNADMMAISALDDIAWLLNIRGNDVSYCPFVISYVIVEAQSVTLFVHESKLQTALKNSLLRDGIILKDYDSFFDTLLKIKNQKIMMEPATASARMYQSLETENQLIDSENMIGLMKAVKSPNEIANMRESQIADGVALLHFLDWLRNEVPKGEVSELSVAAQLETFRRMHPLCMGPSFNTIAGYKENAAMMHYSATEQCHSMLKEEGFLLFDSGGQYLNGTTDITRTVALGPLTDEERLDYTLTLKSHIGLAQAVFLEGTCGPHLDILARLPMWQRGLDYKCGTGHGVGYVLSVHEGPHTIRCNQNAVPLEVGMIVTNEPGVYKPNQHGVRIENTLLVKEREVTSFGRFLAFETISYCPIDTSPLIKNLMTKEEIEWLNQYHQSVRKQLEPHVTGEVLKLLLEMTEEF